MIFNGINEERRKSKKSKPGIHYLIKNSFGKIRDKKTQIIR